MENLHIDGRMIVKWTNTSRIGGRRVHNMIHDWDKWWAAVNMEMTLRFHKM